MIDLKYAKTSLYNLLYFVGNSSLTTPQVFAGGFGELFRFCPPEIFSEQEYAWLSSVNEAISSSFLPPAGKGNADYFDEVQLTARIDVLILERHRSGICGNDHKLCRSRPSKLQRILMPLIMFLVNRGIRYPMFFLALLGFYLIIAIFSSTFLFLLSGMALTLPVLIPIVLLITTVVGLFTDRLLSTIHGYSSRVLSPGYNQRVGLMSAQAGFLGDKPIIDVQSMKARINELLFLANEDSLTPQFFSGGFDELFYICPRELFSGPKYEWLTKIQDAIEHFCPVPELQDPPSLYGEVRFMDIIRELILERHETELCGKDHSLCHTHT